MNFADFIFGGFFVRPQNPRSPRNSPGRTFSDDRQEGIPPEGSAVEAVDGETFNFNVFYVIVDAVIAGFSTHYDAAYKIDNVFGFLW